METQTNPVLEKDTTDKIIEICGTARDPYTRQILLGAKEKIESDEVYLAELKKLNIKLRKGSIHRIGMIKRIINLAFLYIISKYTTLSMEITSGCEARIYNAVGNLYNSYNVDSDVVQYIILNMALGLDASDKFKEKFELIASGSDFYRNTHEYINIFNHLQKLRKASAKSKNLDSDLPETIYKLLVKVRFVCDLKICKSDDFYDANSNIIPCKFEIDSKKYSSKYALAIDRTDGYDRFVFLRSIDEITVKSGVHLRLNYSDVGSDETGEIITVAVVTDDAPRADERIVHTKSIGMFYSYITGDLLRKRHRMSFCNGLSSYRYFGELVASVTDALEKIVVAPDKRFAVVDKYILPVIQRNFNICKEDCVCLGTGCNYTGTDRPCNKERIIDIDKSLNAKCVSNMDIVSILTILFSVVGCRDILPQIFEQCDFDSQALDILFDTINNQLEKRFSEFKSERVNMLRDEFFKKSIEYLSLDINEDSYNDPQVALSLRPFRVRAYTDALIAVLENLDYSGDGVKAVSPIGSVYSISNKIEIIGRLRNIKDVRSTLRDTVKVLLAYYAGLSACKQQQLSYEVKSEQNFSLSRETVNDCERSIKKAFFDGVDERMRTLGADPSFYSLFKALLEDNERLKDDISIMLGRETVNVRTLKRFIRTDDKNGKCYLVAQHDGDLYECDLDDEVQCELDAYKDTFVDRVIELLNFFNGEDAGGHRFACYPQVLTHTSSQLNVDRTTISAFTSYDRSRNGRLISYFVITYFKYEIGKRYFYISPKKYEKTRWITCPILISCSEFYDKVFRGIDQ